MDLRDGIVTFLFADIEGSTRLGEDAPEVMVDALRIHEEEIGSIVGQHHAPGPKVASRLTYPQTKSLRSSP